MDQVTIPMAVLLDDALHPTAKALYAMLVSDPEISIDDVRSRLRRPSSKPYSRKYLQQLERQLVDRGYVEIHEVTRRGGVHIERRFLEAHAAGSTEGSRLAS